MPVYMYCTLFTLLVAIYLFFHPVHIAEPLGIQLIGIAMLAIAITFILIQSLIRALAWSPMQRADHQITPHLLEMYRKDTVIRYINFYLRLFPLITFFIAADLLLLKSAPIQVWLAIWIILLGLCLDAINHYLKKVLSYLNPFSAIEMFTKAAKASIKEEQEGDLVDWLDGLAEIAVKGIQNTNIALSTHAVDETQSIAKNFLEASRSISHTDQDAQTKALGINDKVGYILFFLYQRLEQVNTKAVEKNYETISSHVISSLGKIAIYAAKFDITLVSYPIHFIGKLTKKAEDHHMHDIPLKSSFVLLEIAKAIITETDITYAELEEPYLSIINHLNDIAKEIFKQDKSINLSVVTQPLKDLQELFKNEKFLAHRDAPVIIQHLNDVFGEWDALDLVMKSIPPLPTAEEEQKEIL